MFNLDCDPVPSVGLQYVGFVNIFFASYAVSASLNTDTRETISVIQASIRRAGVLSLTDNAPALALKENGFISSRAALWKAHPLQKPKQIRQAKHDLK